MELTANQAFLGSATTLEVIERDGRRRSFCRACQRYHKPENCPQARAERRALKKHNEALMSWAFAYQAELARIDSGDVIPTCMVCGGPGNRPNYASAVAYGEIYACESCLRLKAKAR